MTLTYWHWWIAGLILLGLELLAPGTFFLWLAIAAGLVGTVLLIAPAIGWQSQLLLFGVLSIASVVVWKYYRRGHHQQTDQPALNRRSEQYVGRTFTLSEPIVNGSGKIHVDDSTWKVRGGNALAGNKVRVIATDGAVLIVESAD